MTCTECGHKILPHREWDHLPEEQRSNIRLQVGKKCRRCYDRQRRGRGDDRTTWPLKDLIEEAEFLFGSTSDAQSDVKSVAFRLGLKPESLVRQYKRAFQRGITTRQLTYRRTA